MSDNSNSDTSADEQTVAELKERIGELEERVEQQEAQRGTSRRQFLGSLTGIASAGAAGYYLGTRRASAAPNWGAATGQQGTQSTPLQQVIAQTGTFESVSTVDITATGSGRIGGSIRLGQKLLQATAPDSTTNTYDPSTDLPEDSYWQITVSSDNSGLPDSYDYRGFKGLFYVQYGSSDPQVSEILTVAGLGASHIASLDTNGVITYGTDYSVGARADIVVSAIRMG